MKRYESVTVIVSKLNTVIKHFALLNEVIGWQWKSKNVSKVQFTRKLDTSC